MNTMPSAKYKQVPNEVEKNTRCSEANWERFNFARLEKSKREKSRLEKFDKKIYKRKKLKLRSQLELGEEALISSHRESEKKTILEDFTKAAWTTSLTFIIKRYFRLETYKKEISFHWLKSTKAGKKLKFRFQREEIFAISDNFN